jgi:hypothetical protein
MNIQDSANPRPAILALRQHPICNQRAARILLLMSLFM